MVTGTGHRSEGGRATGLPPAAWLYVAVVVVSAVALLGQAVERGYTDAWQLRTDADLEAVRGRDDFRQLLRRLEAQP